LARLARRARLHHHRLRSASSLPLRLFGVAAALLRARFRAQNDYRSARCGHFQNPHPSRPFSVDFHQISPQHTITFQNIVIPPALSEVEGTGVAQLSPCLERSERLRAVFARLPAFPWCMTSWL